jgi:hypothetical protein
MTESTLHSDVEVLKGFARLETAKQFLREAQERVSLYEREIERLIAVAKLKGPKP